MYNPLNPSAKKVRRQFHFLPHTEVYRRTFNASFLQPQPHGFPWAPPPPPPLAHLDPPR